MSASPPATAVTRPSLETRATELSELAKTTSLKTPVTDKPAVSPGASVRSVAESTGFSAEKTAR